MVKKNFWIEEQMIHISGVGQVVICLRQFRTKDLNRQQRKSEDYELEKELIAFESKEGIKLFTDEDLRVYCVQDRPIVAIPKGTWKSKNGRGE